jgi:hypothetical protein
MTTPRCDRCWAWKRRDAEHGTCWQRVNEGVNLSLATVREDGSCDQFTAKVVMVGQHTERATA